LHGINCLVEVPIFSPSTTRMELGLGLELELELELRWSARPIIGI
jgi:hypothetical protein